MKLYEIRPQRDKDCALVKGKVDNLQAHVRLNSAEEEESEMVSFA